MVAKAVVGVQCITKSGLESRRADRGCNTVGSTEYIILVTCLSLEPEISKAHCTIQIPAGFGRNGSAMSPNQSSRSPHRSVCAPGRG